MISHLNKSLSNGNMDSDFYKIILVTLIVYSIISVFFGYSYDETTFASVPVFFYYYGFNPFFYWKFGVYYLGILLAGYFPSVLLNMIGLHNVFVEQLGVKLPMVFSFVFSSFLIYKILVLFNIGKTNSRIVAYSWLFNPVIFFYAVFFGNPLIICVLFLLASYYTLITKKFSLSMILLAISASIYLYPVFLFPWYLLYSKKNSNFRSLYKQVLLFISISGLGTFFTYIIYYVKGISFSLGTVTGSGYASLSSSLFVPANWSLYFLLFDGTHIQLPYFAFQIIFISITLGVPLFLVIRNKTIKDEQLLLQILILVSLSFAFLSPTADPQYIQAFIPFVLIFTTVRNLIKLTWVVEIIGVLNLFLVMFVNPYNFNQFYIDAYPSFSRFFLPYNNNYFNFFNEMYLILAVILLLVFLSIFKRKKRIYKQTRFIKSLVKKRRYHVAGLLIFLVISFSIIAPGITTPPREFVFQSNPVVNIPQAFITQNGTNVSYSYSAEEWTQFSAFARTSGNVSLTLVANPIPSQIGALGQNAFVAFNVTHEVGELFHVNYRSVAEFQFLLLNLSSFMNTVVTLFSNNSPSVGPLESWQYPLLNVSHIGVGYDPAWSIYLVTVKYNGILAPGNYSIIFKTENTSNSYIMAWNGSPQLYNVSKVFVQGNNKNLLTNPSKLVLLGMAVSLYDEEELLIHINGVSEALKPSASDLGITSLTYSFPPVTNSNGLINLSMPSSVSKSYSFSLIMGIPYPSGNYLLIYNWAGLLSGVLLFTLATISVWVLFGKLKKDIEFRYG